MNRVFLLGTVKSDLQRVEFKNGAHQVLLDLETTEDDVDDRSGETFVRKQQHRLVIGGKLLETISAIAFVGRELSIEGKLCYWKSGAVIRVSSIKSIDSSVTNAEQKVLSSTHRSSLDFLNAPAIARVVSRA